MVHWILMLYADFPPAVLFLCQNVQSTDNCWPVLSIFSMMVIQALFLAQWDLGIFFCMCDCLLTFMNYQLADFSYAQIRWWNGQIHLNWWSTLKPHEYYLSIGQNEHSIIYWTNQRGC